jgi:hypothetical protein
MRSGPTIVFASVSFGPEEDSQLWLPRQQIIISRGAKLDLTDDASAIALAKVEAPSDFSNQLAP